MKYQFPILILFFLFIISCNPKIDSETYSSTQKKGNEISNLAQTTLLANVGKAIQKGGPQYAVEFCNLKAASIIDSLDSANDCTISRVSAKNRNPENGLKTAQEKEMWEIFQNETITDTIIQIDKNLVFYKPIKIALPACLKCHGNPDSDINQATKTKLQNLYPNDLATGYKLNDFRGLWKIEFEAN